MSKRELSIVSFAGLLLVGWIAAIAGVTAQSNGGQKAVGTVKEVMQAITVPTSDVVFKAGANAPADDAAWTKARNEALALAESANLLLIADRAPTGEEWARLAIAQREAAVVAMRAAESHKAEALSDAADALYETCSNCHDKYMKK